MSGKKIIVVGDTHMPWMSKPSFSKMLDILKVEGKSADYVVQLGDLYDMFSQGRWARTFDLITPKQEMIDARAMAEEFWRVLQKRCPNARCHQIMGNHDVRPIKKILDKAPELTSLLDVKHLWKFDGVETSHDERQELLIGDICFMHGFRSQLGQHARFNQMKTVCGHSHTPGILYFPVRDRLIFEMNAGYIGDPEAVPLQYTQQKMTRWVQSFAIIDKLGPRVITL